MNPPRNSVFIACRAVAKSLSPVLVPSINLTDELIYGINYKEDVQNHVFFFTLLRSQCYSSVQNEPSNTANQALANPTSHRKDNLVSRTKSGSSSICKQLSVLHIVWLCSLSGSRYSCRHRRSQSDSFVDGRPSLLCQ